MGRCAPHSFSFWKSFLYKSVILHSESVEFRTSQAIVLLPVKSVKGQIYGQPKNVQTSNRSYVS